MMWIFLSVSVEDTQLVLQDNPRVGCIFNRVFGLSVLSGDPPNSPIQMVAGQFLDVINFKCVNEDLLHPQQRQRVLDLKPFVDRLDEVLCLLQRVELACRRCLELDDFPLRVHPDI